MPLRSCFFLFLLWMLPGRAFAVDPIAELHSFSNFGDIQLESLGDGKIILETEPPVDFPRLVSSRACYVVMASAKKTASLYQTWDAGHHESLKLHSQSILHSPPVQDDFRDLNLALDLPSFGWFVRKTFETEPAKSDLNFSIEEAAQLEAERKSAKNSVEAATLCWKKILKSRAAKFQTDGLAELPPYESAGSYITVASEIQNILNETVKIKEHFSSLLSESLWIRKKDARSFNPTYYWQLIEINNHAGIALGATYYMEHDGTYQILDCKYYTSGDIYASFTLRQIWPVTIHGNPASLVWRKEFTSAPLFSCAKSVEQMAPGGATFKAITSAIHEFQEEATKAP